MLKADWCGARTVITEAHTILIVTHVKPDGDAIGSMLALAGGLRGLDKHVDTAVDGGVPDFLRYLNGWRRVRDRLKRGRWDLMIAVDASDEERTGLVGAYGRRHSSRVLNLDHHATNTGYGDVVLVESGAVSSTEIVYRLFKLAGIPVSQAVAESLLTGLITDTMGFRTSNVNPSTLEIARDLALVGAPLAEIIDRTLVARPFSTIALWQQVFPSISLTDRIISASVTLDNLKAAGLQEATDGGLVSTLLSANEVLVAVIFKELPDGRVELSIRSKNGVDVGRVALAVGGGGHRQAAGATVDGPLDAARDRILPLLKLAIEQSETENA